MSVKSTVWDVNKFANIKRYGSAYKLTLLKTMPSDTEHVRDVFKDLEKGYSSCKMDCNISRARSRIFELAMCNQWDYFVTLTLDKTKYDRSDLEVFRADLSRFIRKQRETHKTQISYLFIPELHDDLINWHIHGLMQGLPFDQLIKFTQEDKLPKILRQMLMNGRTIYNWPQYATKFGFVTVEQVQNAEAISKYITKYITKDVAKSVQEVGSRMFYNSHGLQGLEIIEKGTLAHAPLEWEFENDYVKILWIKPDEVNYYVKGGLENESIRSL